MRFSVTHSATYDTLVLPGFLENQVVWDVACASRNTKFEFIVPYANNSAELASLNGILTGISAIPTNVSLPYDTKLILPDVVSPFGTSCNRDLLQPSVHITIPRTVRNFCIGSICRPVVCPFGTGSADLVGSVSSVPSNTKLLFGSSLKCDIVEPSGWKEFVNTEIGNSSFVSYEEWYTEDLDGDGASNIIEYYGLKLGSLFADIGGGNRSSRLLQDLPSATSTDPRDPDTDNDLFTDGYELLYGMNPLVPNNVSADSDGDGLTDFQEQVFGTNPFKADSDGDNVTDAVELQDGTDPLDDSDFVSATSRRNRRRFLQKKTVPIRLTIGDPSGSHSERYTIRVGAVEHAATQFGVVATATYNFAPGVYTVTVRHVDSNLATPDYDYQASISWDVTSQFVITLSDPQRLLGFHSESSVDYTVGKSATLTIKELNDTCSATTCAECNANANCEWDPDTKSCESWSSFFFSKDKPEDCACEKCKAWAEVEVKNLDWIDTLPHCPCKVVPFTETVRTRFRTIVYTWLRPVTTNGAVWEKDQSCNPNKPKNCDYYHKGAYGCLRAEVGSHGQQCCYNKNGGYEGQGSLAAGTPDYEKGTVTNVYDHHVADVWTFEDCCKNCEIPNVCEKYIGSASTPGARSDPRGCK